MKRKQEEVLLNLNRPMELEFLWMPRSSKGEDIYSSIRIMNVMLGHCNLKFSISTFSLPLV